MPLPDIKHDILPIENDIVRTIFCIRTLFYVSASCRNRCYEPLDVDSASCRCDSQCVETHSCCFDYQDICLLPTQSWECTALRCGERRLSGSRCHCSEDCMNAGDCCSNYNSICEGEFSQWVQDECVDMSTAKCPAR
uniref:SMB domain-containing protein n=1 Tax=Sinocyclocheilus anshuiensis TaxID=1608454 RepID=A0A671LCD7_9TELE